MAAYDRPTPNKYLIATLLKQDNQENSQRTLTDAICKLLNKNYATIQSDSLDTLATAIVSAGLSA